MCKGQLPIPKPPPANPIIAFVNRRGCSNPAKKISDPADIDTFKKSIAYERLIKLIQTISLSVTHKKVPTEMTKNDSVVRVLHVLTTLEQFINETPPIDGPRRFGNLAYRKWFEKVEKLVLERHSLQEWLDMPSISITFVPDNSEPLYDELYCYFLGAFGSKERLDFGTGHELSFLAFLGGLTFMEMLTEVQGEDWLLVFSRYFKLIRKLVTTYSLEPAGSHGVWGLDDHFHLPYIFGSAQLVDIKKPDSPTPELPPSSILRRDIVARLADENLYFGAINFILHVKKGPFHEHSPVLYDVTGVPTWHKIHRGMIKMYLAEVLGKYTVVQHFYFGSGLYPWLDKDENPLPTTDPSSSAVSEYPIN